MKRGLLLIDRGSREAEVRKELDEICAQIKKKSDYAYVEYCFLEVTGPFIPDVLPKALDQKLDELTIVPYFLYAGKKLKDAVNNAIAMQKGEKTKIRVARPMKMHQTMIDLVCSRVRTALDEGGLAHMNDKDVDVLIIGHGSVDPNAKRSLDYLVENLKGRYKNTSYCFLEIEQPDIAAGIAKAENDSPNALAIVFYFLHEGAHVKRDIYIDLNPALESSSIKKHVITKHLGADPEMIELIMQRASEVESNAD